ncbi:MAG: hypothetical protein M3464_00515 [Chloroflexota bacterium]|nr:hypothetical protein [Chloroflexota bacterium]
MVHAATRHVAGQTFDNQTIEVDGQAYEKCQFIECRIIFRGIEGVSFDECTFTRCDWRFSGPARNTLSYLSAIYRGLDDPGQEMVEGIFDGVRFGLVEQDELLNPPLAAR